jgi:large subunit ribosomal protein L25
MTSITLIAEARPASGKGSARALRRAKRIPAIIYGKNQENVSISLDELELTKLHRKAGFTTKIFDISLNGKTYPTLPKVVQLHPVTDMIEHIDFMHVSADVEVKVLVRLHIINEDKSVGIKRGGVLNIVSRDIELICHPSAIPSGIDVDVATLNIGDSIHIQDLKLPEKVRPASHDKNLTIATLVGRGGDDNEAEANRGAAK